MKETSFENNSVCNEQAYFLMSKVLYFRFKKHNNKNTSIWILLVMILCLEQEGLDFHSELLLWKIVTRKTVLEDFWIACIQLKTSDKSWRKIVSSSPTFSSTLSSQTITKFKKSLKICIQFLQNRLANIKSIYVFKFVQLVKILVFGGSQS